MTQVTAVRTTFETEQGTHIVDFTRTLGQRPVNAQIFVQKHEEISGGFNAVVIAGCMHGLELYSEGSEVQLVKTENSTWVLRSNERH